MTSNTATTQKSLSVVLGEDAWQGDAYAVVSVDGIIAFQGSVTASKNGSGQQIDLGSFDATVDHKITVKFTNDAYGGSPATDRNLYVKDVLVDGAPTGQSQTLLANGTASFAIPSGVVVAPPASLVVIGSGDDTVQFSISETAWQGDSQFVVLLDGQQVGAVQTATALHGSSQEQIVNLKGDFSSAVHQVSILFLNDAYGGTAGSDRNLFVDAVSVNGVDQGGSKALFNNGDASFKIQTPKNQASLTSAPLASGTGAQTIAITASEDAWSGDALLTVSVDGVQVGGPLAVTANHAAGASEQLLIKGDFGSGGHTVSVAFTNDAYGGSAATDRNLYIQTVTLDGTILAGALGALFSNGAVSGIGSFAQPTITVPPSDEPVSPTPVPTSPVAPVVPPTAPVTPTPVPPPPAAGATADVGLIPVGTPVYAAGSLVETVGIGKQFQTIGAAVAAAQDGTVILVDAGTYTNDFATVYAKISLIAVGGRVHEVATISPPNYKGLITVENDLRVEGFTFEGVHIPDEFGHNGAGIRVDGGNLTLINDEFKNNQNGLLSNSGNYSITIDHSVFNDNGGNDGNGAGNIHNVYIGAIASVTATNSIFENAQVGHEFKSRANVNVIDNNEFISGVGIGTGSYDIDLPNGGKDTVTNNTIIKGPNAENTALVHFGGEGIPYAGSTLTLQGNLFESQGNPSALALLNQTSITAQITGNIFADLPASAIAQGPATINGNYDASGNPIQNQKLVGVLPGSTFIVTDSLPHTILLDGGLIQAAEGGAGLLSVTAFAGHIIAIGGSGGLNVTESTTSGGNQFTTAVGSTNILNLGGVGQDSIDSEGRDTIIAGDGNQSAQLNGNATVVGGAGSSYWSVNGNATINTGSGSAFITLAATGTLSIFGTNDFFKLDSNGGTVVWTTTNSGVAVSGFASSGAFSAQFYNGIAHVTTSGGPIGTVLQLSKGDANVTSTGADTIYAGGGSDTIIVSGAAKIYAGAGTLAVFGRGNLAGADVYGRGGDYVIDGDTGNITYHGGTLASTVEAKLSNIGVIGGSGRVTVNGGSRDRIVGGSGGLVFNGFGGGANFVTTVASSSSVLNVSGINTIQSYGNDTITLDSGNSDFALYGTSTLVLETGNSRVDVFGTETITTASGSDYLSLHAGAAVTLLTTNQDNVDVSAATLMATFTDPTAGGAVSSVTISGPGFANVSTSPGSGISITTAAGAPVSVTAAGQVAIGGNGSSSIHLSAGSAYVSLTGSANEVWAGSGALRLHDGDPAGGNFILHGGTGSIMLDADASHLTFLGGSGAATLTGGVLDIVAGAGDITVTGNYGSNVASFVGGSGTATLALDGHGSAITFGTGQTSVHGLGWGAANTYNFLAGLNGTDAIDNFRVGLDKAVLGTGVTINSASEVGGSAHFLLSNGANVTFAGVANPQHVFG